MTEAGQDRLFAGLGSLLGFAIGGFIGANVGNAALRDKNDPYSDPSPDQEAAALVFGVGGAALGSAIGAMIGIPSREAPQVGTSAPPQINAPPRGFP